MSLHFDMAMALDLKPSTPQQVIDAIGYLARTEDVPFDSPPDHEFFRTEGWRNVLQSAPEATYCPGSLYKSFRKTYRFTRRNVDHYRHTLGFRCYMLDDGFYELFYPLVEWLALHSETQGYVGYYREEARWWPTLLFFKNDEVYSRDAKESPVPLRKDAPLW